VAREVAADGVTVNAVGPGVVVTWARYAGIVSSKGEPITEHGPGLRDDGARVCSIADALDVVGERYSLLILRELGFGVTRFSDIRHNTGAPRETLSIRLRKLEDAGVITRRRYSEHPPRDEYLLTDAGEALTPILRQLREWGEQHAVPPQRDA
jgi:DNA-binding HxlR family transcriptional regulator